MICPDRIASTGYESMAPASSARNAAGNFPSILSSLYANGTYSLSDQLHRISLRSDLNAGSSSSSNAGLDFMIFFMATCNSFDNFKSGATEKNLENRGSMIIKIINITAALNVLKFFLAIFKTAVV